MADFDANSADLVVALMGQMVNDAHTTGQTLIELKDKEIAKLRAERNLVRENMEYLLEQPWTPSARSIERALYPSASAVERAVESGMGEFGYDR